MIFGFGFGWVTYKRLSGPKAIAEGVNNPVEKVETKPVTVIGKVVVWLPKAFVAVIPRLKKKPTGKLPAKTTVCADTPLFVETVTATGLPLESVKVYE